MNRHTSTISRELRRNRGQRVYRPKQAQALSGSSGPGGIDYEFLGDHSDGQLFVSYDIEDMDGIAEMVALGEFGKPTFQTPGDQLQIFEVECEGTFDTLKLTFAYDAE